MADKEWVERVERAWIIPQSSTGSDQKAFSFDAVIRESHHSELEITDNPLETGVVASDHAFMRPLRLDIEAMVGDCWLHALDENGQPVEDVWESGAGRSVNAFALVQELQRLAEPFSVQTGLRLYTNMVVLTLDADQDAPTATALLFRASLREVIRVTTETVTYPPRKSGKPARQASKKVSAGEKQAVEPSTTAKKQSILFQNFGEGAKNALGTGG